MVWRGDVGGWALTAARVSLMAFVRVVGGHSPLGGSRGCTKGAMSSNGFGKIVNSLVGFNSKEVCPPLVPAKLDASLIGCTPSWVPSEHDQGWCSGCLTHCSSPPRPQGLWRRAGDDMRGAVASQSLLAWGAAAGGAYVVWVRPDQQRREQIEVRSKRCRQGASLDAVASPVARDTHRTSYCVLPVFTMCNRTLS